MTKENEKPTAKSPAAAITPAGNGCAKSEAKMPAVRYETGGVFNAVDQLARAIKSLGEKHNLISPGGALNVFPHLHAAGISFVFIDPDRETYGIAGKSERGLSKTALDRIAAASGVQWDPRLCGRVDDGSNPYVVEYQAAATVLQLDGTERIINATKRIDLRAEKDASPDTWGTDAQEIAKESAANNKDPWPRILQQRQHILSLAETKAKNRAIRTLGVKTAYSPEDIKKGFAVVRLGFTGQSDDPDVQREVELMIAQRALTGRASLYGGGERAKIGPPTRPAVRVPKIAAEAPDEEEPEIIDIPAEAENEAGESNQAPHPPADDPMLICGKKGEDGKYPRKHASEFSAKTLREKIDYAEKSRGAWDPKWADKNEAELKAMKAWLAYKEFEPSQGELPGAPADGGEVPW